MIFAWKTWAALVYARNERRALEGGEQLPFELTVLQPILSGDPTLEACLRANVEAHGDGTEFVWLVDESDAEALRVAGELQRPGVSVVQCAPADPGVNPKVDKLERALENVRTEFVAVLDDDTTVGSTHMRRAVQVLRGSSCEGGLYTGLPTYRAEASGGPRAAGRVGAGLITAFVNSSSALTYLPAAHSAPPITLNGMFYVTRTDVLRSIGGFTAIRQELCDDLAMAQLYQRADRPIHQGSMAQLLCTGEMGIGPYVKRMHRWFVFAKVLVRRMSQRQRMRLGITLGAPPLLLWVGLACALQSAPVAIALLAILIGRHAAIAKLLDVTREPRDAPCPAATLNALSTVVSELLLPFHALHAWLRPTIQWRTRRMRVRRDGSFESLPKKP